MRYGSLPHLLYIALFCRDTYNLSLLLSHQSFVPSSRIRGRSSKRVAPAGRQLFKSTGDAAKSAEARRRNDGEGLCLCFRLDQHLVRDGMKAGTDGPFATTCGHRRSQRDKPLTELAYLEKVDPSRRMMRFYAIWIAPTPCRHWARAVSASSWAKAVAMKAATTRRPCLPAWASTLRMKCTRQRCQEACSTLETAAFSPSCASEMTSLTPRRPRRAS